MKVVGINGSGRPGGNTAILVQAILDGAGESGAETAFFELAGRTIPGCRACNACRTGEMTHRCVVKDEMQRFHDLAAETDVWVFASPIYLDHITGPLMSFIQRLYCYIDPELKDPCWPRKDVRAVLGITYGAVNPNQYDYVLDWMERRMKGYFKIPTVGRFKVHKTSHTNNIERTHPEVQRALAFGKTL